MSFMAKQLSLKVVADFIAYKSITSGDQNKCFFFSLRVSLSLLTF